MRIKIQCPMALAGALAAVGLIASVASAASAVPFQASFAETFSVYAGGPCPANAMCAAETGTGNATHMGKSSESFTAVVSLPISATGCTPESSSGTLTAANGDEVFVTASGTFCQTSVSSATDTGTFQVTGGTGRFVGATGGGAYDSTININATWSGGTSTSTYTGTISTVGS